MRILKYFFLIIVIICAHVGLVHGQDQQRDSLLMASEKKQPDSSKVLVLTKLSNLFINSNIDSAEYFAQEALVLANESDFTEGLGEIYAVLGDIEVRRDNLDKAKEQYLTAISYHEDAGFKRKMAPIFMVLGNIFLSQDNYVEALNYYQQSMQLAEGFDNKRALQYVYNNLGITYSNLQDYEKSLNYYERSLEVTKALGDTMHIASIYLNIGIVYEAEGKFELARSYYDKSKAMSQHNHDMMGEALAWNALGELEIRQQRYREAVPYLFSSLQAIENTEATYPGPRSTTKTITLTNLGKSYFFQGALDSAMIYLLAGLDLALQNGQVSALRDNYELLSMIYEQRKMPQKALEHYKLFKMYSDSIQNEDAIKRVTTLELQYAFDKERRERELQLTKQEAAQKRKEMRYLMIAGGAVLSLIIILLLFFLQRNKVHRIELSKKNLELEKDNLTKELDYKNKELTTNVMYLLKKNEMIMNITDRLKKAKISFKGENRQMAEEIIRELESGITKDTWKEFELRFQDVHTDFYNKLNQMFPDLSPNELRLSAFLRLNMTTKDIAAITYQSVNSINIARHRLRKKLNIEQEENLIKFLTQL